MNAFFLERWAEEGPGIVAPIAREIARIGRALNRMRIDNELVIITERGIEGFSKKQLAQALHLVFIFKRTSNTGGTWVQGKGYIAGADTTITDQPTTISGVTTSTKYWILHNFPAATFTWQSGTSYPANSDSQEVYRMLEITCADNVITDWICPHPCDIHATAKST